MTHCFLINRSDLSSFVDTYPPFLDGTIFINVKKEKSRWLIVDDGDLQCFDGELSNKPMDTIQLLNKLSTKGERWATCKDIEVIRVDRDLVNYPTIRI